ncbi:hypothetical protein ACFRJ9_09160 [Paenarthrobacter sp. NPDC056912]|uniref:hypothetical protein n=1 Tax=Paenarthrobacter sp. NPDC056912 TaxID=3345965 RepID=UPI0036721E97
MVEENMKDAGSKELQLRVLGTRISVVMDSGVTNDLLLELQRAWSRCLDHAGSPPISHRLHWAAAFDHSELIPFRARVSSMGGTSFVAGQTFRDFAATLTTTITLAGVAVSKGDLLMLHAAGLCDPRTGRTTALVGRSGMGKTTATRRLGVDLGYVTDETVALDGSNAIVPYPKPLSVITQGHPAPKRQVGPDELGLMVAPDAPTLASVALLDRNCDSELPLITPLGHAEAIIELAPQASFLGAVEQPLQRLCSILDRTGGAVRVSYREAKDLAGILPQLMERAPMAKTWSAALVERTETAPGGTAHSGFFRRGTLIDAVEIPAPTGQGTELVAMTEHGIVHVTGIGPVVWNALAVPCDINAIAERIAPHVGLPHGYAAHLRSVVEELKSHGILVDS